MADIVKPPKNPSTLATSAKHPACHGWNSPPQRGAEQRVAAHAAEKAFPSSVRADRSHDDVLADELAPNVLKRIAHLHNQNEEKEQPVVGAGIRFNLQIQKRRRKTQAEYANHQPGLNLRHTF